MNEEREPTYYALIPSNVRYDPDLPPNAKLLYGEITALTNQDGCCWAGNVYFANLYGVKKETISRWISKLKEKGYIKVKLFYKKDSKEIDKRIISIDPNALLTKLSIGYCKNNQTPIDKNDKENNTSINNILEYFLQTNVFPKVNKLTDSRRKKLVLRVGEQGEENIIKAIDIAAESDFLKGKNDRGWKMDFDWLIANDTNIVKILEGKYSNKKQEGKKENGRMYGPILN